MFNPIHILEKNNIEIKVGNFNLTRQWYNKLFNDMYGNSEEELKEYLNILNNYWNNGGKIQRVIFSYNEPKLINKSLGNSWTHINNNWKNYIQTIYNFNLEEGIINGDENIWLLNAETPKYNIAIQNSIEQYQNNPEEQELTILDTNKLINLNINKIK